MNEDLRNTILELLASLDDERNIWEPNGFISVKELKEWVRRAE